jgi:choline kinase
MGARGAGDRGQLQTRHGRALRATLVRRSARSDTLAIVLAAGSGSRLGVQPKALLPLNGVCLLDRAAAALEQAGVHRLLIVIGYRSEVVVAHCSRTWRSQPCHVRNTRYAETNTFYSLLVGLQQQEHAARVVVLNGDVVFDHAVISRLIDHHGDLVITADRSTVDDEAVGVSVQDGRVTHIGKQLAAEQCVGEFPGISILSAEGARVYVERASRAAAEECNDLYYDDIYGDLARTSAVGYVPVKVADWAEIDTPADLPRAAAVAKRQDIDPLFAAALARVRRDRWERRGQRLSTSSRPCRW